MFGHHPAHRAFGDGGDRVGADLHRAGEGDGGVVARPGFQRPAVGDAAQLAGQAFINILVNLQLFPSKGMTLPLISYGGSSTIALLLGAGFLLAITRRNPYLSRETADLRELVRP